LFLLFATGVNDTSGTGGKFTASLVDTVGKFATCGLDTSDKFAAGVVDTGANLPPMSLTPVVHLDLRISLQIFAKNCK
jgi:hypothetical protein